MNHEGHEIHEGRVFEELSSRVIGCAIEVHQALGPGLLESSYHQCLCRELSLNGISYESEHPLPIEYKGLLLETGYRVDLLIEDELILELKSVKSIDPIHEAQLLTYLRLSGIRVGIMVNFNVKRLKDGIKRYVL